MPLSEEEQRQFEQLERALAAEDPKFVSTMQGTALHSIYKRRAILAGLGFIAGIGVLMAGAILRNTIVGVLGFVVMVACLYLLALSVRRLSSTDPNQETTETPRPPQPKKPRRAESSGGSFMERMEDRWRRRREEDL